MVPSDQEVRQALVALRNISRDPKQPIKPTEAIDIREQVLRYQ